MVSWIMHIIPTQQITMIATNGTQTLFIHEWWNLMIFYIYFIRLYIQLILNLYIGIELSIGVLFMVWDYWKVGWE